MARDAGPNSADERHHDCAAYNGEGGGQHYQWFAPRLFRAILVQLGCFDVERVTEAVYAWMLWRSRVLVLGRIIGL